MGACMSCNHFCCPGDKTIVFSEITSPKNIVKQDFKDQFIIHKRLSDQSLDQPSYILESPEIKPRRHYRTKTCVMTKKSFLAKAREKHERNSSQTPLVFSVCEDLEVTKYKSVTISDEECDAFRTPQRISLGSPDKNRGDYGIIDL